MFIKKNILGVGFTDEKLKDVLEYLEEIIQKKEKKHFIVTPNPELLVIAGKNSEYKKVLNSADLALIDGVGVSIASRILGRPLKHKISGIDFMESVCSYVAEKPITIGFLGGGPGVAENTAECLLSKYPGLKVGFVSEEWSEEGFDLASKLELRIRNKELREKIINRKSSIVNPKSIDILFVAFGSPKQEIWLKKHLENLPITVAMGVGGAFDMISGKVPRAPVFIRALSLEWLFRLLIQPWRIKRQLKLLVFAGLVLRERFKMLR